jgi:hypothetical protein
LAIVVVVVVADEIKYEKTFQFNGMEWNGMEWNGMEWNGME